MGQPTDRTGEGYRRLPRTIVVTIISGFAIVAFGSLVMQMRARRTHYIKLAKRYEELATRYTQRKVSDSEVAQFSEDEVRNIEDLTHTAASNGDASHAAELRKRGEDKMREAKRLRSRARKWVEVAGYYTAMRQRYEDAAERPWWSVPPPSGDLLDVENAFLSDQGP